MTPPLPPATPPTPPEGGYWWPGRPENLTLPPCLVATPVPGAERAAALFDDLVRAYYLQRRGTAGPGRDA